MPNVAPRGLHARRGGAWRPPTAVWARDAGVWKQADYVWVYRDGTWQLLWARVPAPPATAAAVWVQPSSVQISWTPPAANPNSQWIVRRADGSVVATVPVGTLTVTDPTPLLNTTGLANATVPAYTIEGTDGTATSARFTTNEVTYNLTPASLAASVAYPNGTSSTVTLTWTPNATYGRPQGWRAYLDGVGFLGDVLPGTATALTLTNQGRGLAANYRIVPMAQTPSGAWVQAGNVNPVVANLAAVDPIGVGLAAVGVSNLRLTWAHPSGGRTAYEVQRYVNSWEPHAVVGADTTLSDWTTGVAGWMRVRTLSAGGPSGWVQAGPVTPVTDTTGPSPSTIQSWMPEASFGRMVVRATTSPDADTATAQIFCNNGSGWVSSWGPNPVGPNQQLAWAACTGEAGQNMQVLVRTWDANGNINTADAYAAYVLAPAIVNASPVDGYSARNGAWRNDSIAGQYSIMHGTTAAGENYGMWFYGNQLTDYMVGRTWQGGWVETWRQNSQGAGAGIQPGLVAHTDAYVGAVPPPVSNQGVEVLGSALARTGTVTGIIVLSNEIVALIQSGWKGLAVWRCCATTTNPDLVGSHYMKLGDAGAWWGDRQSGRVIMSSLG